VRPAEDVPDITAYICRRVDIGWRGGALGCGVFHRFGRHRRSMVPRLLKNADSKLATESRDVAADRLRYRRDLRPNIGAVNIGKGA
jgi:hypothetical protein